MSILVTGGAGFIGSCVVRMLNDEGADDIIIVDNIASTEKWKNIENKKFRNYYNKDEFLECLPKIESIEKIVHLGACSSTTERDFDYLWKNNVEYSKRLWEYATEKRIPFIYASSAATYGDGTKGFDDKKNIDVLMPLNGYGYSKQSFDLWTENYAEGTPGQHVGLKFFNVYGPNEYFKGSMASMIFHGFNQIKASGKVKLFKSYNPLYKDGEQLRDFVYVKDICSVIKWLLEHKSVNGIFNVGTGTTGSFRELAENTFTALNLQPNIEYIEMPEGLKEKYQYYTCADMSKLRDAGYNKQFYSLQEGVTDYVTNYLERNYLCY